MIKLKDVLDKLQELELLIGEIYNIIEITFYSDGSGRIATQDHSFFEFEEYSDLKYFMRLDNEYLIKNRRKYPI